MFTNSLGWAKEVLGTQQFFSARETQPEKIDKSWSEVKNSTAQQDSRILCEKMNSCRADYRTESVTDLFLKYHMQESTF